MASPVLLLSIAGASADRIERHLHARGFDVTAEMDLPAAVRAAPQHRLVIVEAADADRVVALTQRLRAEIGSELPILAVASSHEIDERVALLEAGADDVLGRPFDERELEALVEALLLRTAPALPMPESAAGGVRGSRTRRGRVFVFAAAKGGTGITTMAVNVAVALAMRAHETVAIADLDLYHGQVAVHLDVRGDISTAQLARLDRSGIQELLPTASASHATGLVVFGGPHRPDEGTQVGAADAHRLVDALRVEHSLLVVDAGTVVDARTVALFEMADRIVLGVTPEIPALRTLHGLLEVVADRGTISDKTLFVLNQTFARPMLSAEQIEENLGLKFALHIPYHEWLYVKSVNEGQPLVTTSPRSEPAAQLRRLAAMLLGEADAEDGEPAKRLLGGLRRRRG